MNQQVSTLERAKELLGELFIMGFTGTELSDETAAFISQAKIGGVILFTQNYQSPEQVAQLIMQVQDCKTELPLWISVDHEGGKVQRFKAPFTLIPNAAAIVAKDSPKLLFELSEAIGRELRSVGINVNFAPVADINSNPNNPVIGVRAFGNSEDQVSKYVSSFVRGHITQGIAPCVKHFPGHGDTNTDSHFALPTVNDTLESLKTREFKPFQKAFKSGARMVMTAHMLNPNLDPKYPATLSHATLQGVLRDELRYTGLIISDDMEMKAITDHFGLEDAPRLALEAGCDLLIYRSESATRKAYTALMRFLEEGKLNPEIVIEAAERSQEYKSDFLLPYEKPDLNQLNSHIGIQEHQDLVTQILTPNK